MTNATHHPRPVVQYLCALLIAIPLVCLIAARTNSTPPKYEAIQYVDMARNGIIGNPNLVSPMAYRPGTPLASRVVADVLSVSIENGFRIVGWISSIAFLMCVFTLARCFTVDYRHALVTMVILGLSFTHLKFPLFFYTLVDGPAYPLMVIAFWALITKRFYLCLLISSIGVLFKEFLAIPLFLVILHFGWGFWRSRSRRDLVHLVVALGIGLGVIGIPRLCIPVSRQGEFVNPLDLRTLGTFLFATLDEKRLFDVMYAAASYWLPTVLLLTPSRFNKLWADLRGRHLWVMSIYLSLVLLLTVYGGNNTFIYIGYSVAAQAVVLALLFRSGVGFAEGTYVVVVMMLYNKTMLHIPLPDHGFDAYIDFYGGWSPRVSLPIVVRFIEMGAFVILAMCGRSVAAKIASDGRRDAPAACAVTPGR
jgi:hypothetical protein